MITGGRGSLRGSLIDAGTVFRRIVFLELRGERVCVQVLIARAVDVVVT